MIKYDHTHANTAINHSLIRAILNGIWNDFIRKKDIFGYLFEYSLVVYRIIYLTFSCKDILKAGINGDFCLNY